MLLYLAWRLRLEVQRTVMMVELRFLVVRQ